MRWNGPRVAVKSPSPETGPTLSEEPMRLAVLWCALALGMSCGVAGLSYAGADDDLLRARIALPARPLRAGEVLELRWSELPARVEEMEILLSVDGGRHYGLRVSPECDPATGRFRWRVPNLCTSAARLRLRLGAGGRELEAEPTRCFTIVGDGDPWGEGHVFHEPGWWPGPVEPAARAPRDFGDSRARIELAGEARLG